MELEICVLTLNTLPQEITFFKSLIMDWMSFITKLLVGKIQDTSE